MSVKLRVVRGPTQARSLKLSAAATVIGRQAGCDLRIPSAEVSRRHCLLSYQNGCVTVEDLDSFNGTFLNGARITGRRLVRPGDELEIGPVTFEVDYELSEAAKRRYTASVLESEEEPAKAEVVEHDSSASTEHIEAVDEVETAEAAVVDDADVEVVLDAEGGEPWHLPQGDNLRNILTDLDK